MRLARLRTSAILLAIAALPCLLLFAFAPAADEDDPLFAIIFRELFVDTSGGWLMQDMTEAERKEAPEVKLKMGKTEEQYTVCSQCRSGLGNIYEGLRYNLKKWDYDQKKDKRYTGPKDEDSLFHQQIKAYTGIYLLSHEEPNANKTGNYYGGQQRFRHYSGPGIRAMFAKYYRKPGGTFAGLAWQRIYDLTLKKNMRETAQMAAQLLKDRQRLDGYAARYRTAMMSDPEFYGPAITGEIMADLYGNEWYNWEKESEATINQTYPCQKRLAERTVGSLVRRHMDGTLPVVLELLGTTLQDYDPQFYATIKNELKY